MQTVTGTNPLWRLPTVEAHTGLSRSEIYRRIKNNEFPKPIKLGARAVAWTASDVQSWINSVVEGSKQ